MSRIKMLFVLATLWLPTAANAAIPNIVNSFPLGPSGIFGFLPFGSPYLTSGTGSSGTAITKRLYSLNSNSSAGTFDSFYYAGSKYSASSSTISIEILGWCETSDTGAGSTLEWQWLYATAVGSMTEGGSTAPTSPTYMCPGGSGAYCMNNGASTGVPGCTITHQVLNTNSSGIIFATQKGSMTANNHAYELWIREFQ